MDSQIFPRRGATTRDSMLSGGNRSQRAEFMLLKCSLGGMPSGQASPAPRELRRFIFQPEEQIF